MAVGCVSRRRLIKCVSSDSHNSNTPLKQLPWQEIVISTLPVWRHYDAVGEWRHFERIFLYCVGNTVINWMRFIAQTTALMKSFPSSTISPDCNWMELVRTAAVVLAQCRYHSLLVVTCCATWCIDCVALICRHFQYHTTDKLFC